jgi:hypothetical protein
MVKRLPYQTMDSMRNLPEFRFDLGVQYSSSSSYPVALEPEIRLMVMILGDAVDCYQRLLNAQNDHGRRQFRDAARWLFGPDEDWIFSFNHICACACVGVDPEYLRAGLRRWKRSAASLPQSAALPGNTRYTKIFSSKPHAPTLRSI